MKECKQDQNLAKCTCTYEPCSRKGLCCECTVYHKEYGELPGCLFPPEWSEPTTAASLALSGPISS